MTKINYLSIILTLSIAFNVFAQDQKMNYILMEQIESEELYNSLPKIDTINLPFRKNAFDIRQIDSKSYSVVMLTTPPVGDQGNQGSCSSWAVSYAAGSILAYSKYNNNWNNAKRSPAYLFNQYKVQQSDGTYGSYISTIVNRQSIEGVCSLNQMPYNQNDYTTQPTPAQRFDAYLNRTSYATISTANLTSVNHYKDILSNGYPIAISIEVTDAFYSMWNSSGIWSTIGTGLGKYHALCIVGFDDTVQRFKVQNSWGTSGGDNGFLWISYNLVQNGVIKNAYVLSSITQDTYPTISGSSKLCTSEQYTVGAIPSGMTVTWGIVEPTHLGLSFQSSGNTATFTRGSNWQGIPYHGTYTIKAVVSNGTASYTATKIITMPQTVTPSIDYQNHSIYTLWQTDQTRTLEAFNTNNTPSQLMQWAVQLPQSTTTSYYYGSTITLTPHLAGMMQITLTNLAGCEPDNSVTTNYFITKRFGVLLTRNDNSLTCHIATKGSTIASLVEDDLYQGEYRIEVCNEQMKSVFSQNRIEPTTIIDLSLLPPGNYSVRLFISGELVDTQALIVK